MNSAPPPSPEDGPDAIMAGIGSHRFGLGLGQKKRVPYRTLKYRLPGAGSCTLRMNLFAPFMTVVFGIGVLGMLLSLAGWFLRTHFKQEQEREAMRRHLQRLEL
jgi:hypothetical protein